MQRRLLTFLASTALSSLLVVLPAEAQTLAYLPSGSGDSVSIIDVATHTVLQNVPVGDSPRDVAFAPDGSRVYVSQRDSVSVIDTATNVVVATIPLAGTPFGLETSPDGDWLYAAMFSADTVLVIDTDTLSIVESLPQARWPNALAVVQSLSRVYVTNMSGDEVSVIDTTTNTVAETITVGNSPFAMALSPDESTLYLTHYRTGAVSVIDTATNTVVDVFPMGTEVNGIVASPDGYLLYVAARGDDQLLVARSDDGAIIRRVAVGNGPEAVDVSPDGSSIYVPNAGDDFISVIDGDSLTVIDEITVPAGSEALGKFMATLVPAPPEGVNLSVQPTAPATYAAELVATPASPVALDNDAGQLNLSSALGYSFSPDETRYVRFECPGVVFAADAEAVYVGSGSASVGALNGLNSSAIHFSITADDAAVDSDGLLTVTGGRSITGTEPVDCTYALYDFPSQAAHGGDAGRVAAASGAYLDFASSTVFTAAAMTATADVEADPAFAGFEPAGATTATTAALVTLEYGPATNVPLTPDATPVMLSDLHATGADGTRIVVDGDFGAAANDDGTFTGGALDRVYLSASNIQCIPGVAADALDATQAVFVVGATPLHRLLCFAPRAGIPVPVADYTAELIAVAATPAYAPQDIGPLPAGGIIRNGTHLQAPLAQVPGGWLSRVVLTNTGAHDRRYVIAVSGETGNLIGTANLTGIVPARGTVVVDLDKVLVSFSGKRRATLNVTVAGPNSQIQGQYQIVNPGEGTLSNLIMVRPGTN